MSSESEKQLEALRRLRSLGLAKPKHITDEAWAEAAPVDITDAVGATKGQIEQRVVEQASLELPKEDKAMVRHFFAQAVATRVEIMNDKGAKASDRLKASETFIDHTIGKPDQVIEHKGSIAMQVMSQMDALAKHLKATTTIDVVNKLAKVPPAVEQFLKAHMPEKHVVGRKVAPRDEAQELSPRASTEAPDGED